MEILNSLCSLLVPDPDFNYDKLNGGLQKYETCRKLEEKKWLLKRAQKLDQIIRIIANILDSVDAISQHEMETQGVELPLLPAAFWSATH